MCCGHLTSCLLEGIEVMTFWRSSAANGTDSLQYSWLSVALMVSAISNMVWSLPQWMHEARFITPKFR